MTDFETAIEEHLIKILKEKYSNYNVVEFRSPLAPEQLVGMITNKLSAGVPCVFVRVASTNTESLDVLDRMYKTNIGIEIVVAAPVVKEKQLPGVKRLTSKMKWEVIKEVLKKPIELEDYDDIDRGFRWEGDEKLFRDETNDAQLVKFVLEGMVVDIDEIIDND